MGYRNWIYRVQFKEPPIQDDDRTDFFFSSLAAIYEQFTPGQVGCKVPGFGTSEYLTGSRTMGASVQSRKKKSRGKRK